MRPKPRASCGPWGGPESRQLGLRAQFTCQKILFGSRATGRGSRNLRQRSGKEGSVLPILHLGYVPDLSLQVPVPSRGLAVSGHIPQPHTSIAHCGGGEEEDPATWDQPALLGGGRGTGWAQPTQRGGAGKPTVQTRGGSWWEWGILG
jgi:hypothetical protein